MTRSTVLCLLVALAEVGCASLPYRTARNEPLCPAVALGQASLPPESCLDSLNAYKPVPVPRGRLDLSKGSLADTPPVFFGLALSGGGSRAANHAMAVMEEFNKLGLMKHVTAISSTSGGGVAGAYYAVKGPDLDWELARKKMATNFRMKWIASSVINFPLTSLTHADRSDLMADIFDDVLFAKATYRDLGHRGPGRPVFIANATAADNGELFTFSEEAFSYRLRSRLDTYPIAQAVVASAAFPGAFNNVTLRRFPHSHPSAPGRLAPMSYLHVLDGGPADNLGVESLLEMASWHNLARSILGDIGEVKREPIECFIAIVDAYPAGSGPRSARMPDPRRSYDHLVDMNMLSAFDALLTARRRNLLGYVGLGYLSTVALIEDPVRGLIENAPDTVVTMMSEDRSRLVYFDVPMAAPLQNKAWQLVKPVLDQRTGVLPEEVLRTSADGTLSNPPSVPKQHFRCVAWHVPLGRLLSIPYEMTRSSEPATVSPAEVRRRARLELLVNQTSTDWRLSGPKNCSASLIQDAIYDAAALAVHDPVHLEKVCTWFKSVGLGDDQCTVRPLRPRRAELPVHVAGNMVPGFPNSFPVSCDEGAHQGTKRPY